MDDTREGNLSTHQPYDESPGGETPLISNRKSSTAASPSSGVAIAAGGAASMASPAAAGTVTSQSQLDRMTPRTEREFVISAPASLLLQRILSHGDDDGAEEYKEEVMTMDCDGGNIE
eukprot:scaffold92009_cov60-Cyclotella_meneghiniana.AAC.4